MLSVRVSSDSAEGVGVGGSGSMRCRPAVWHAETAGTGVLEDAVRRTVSHGRRFAVSDNADSRPMYRGTACITHVPSRHAVPQPVPQPTRTEDAVARFVPHGGRTRTRRAPSACPCMPCNIQANAMAERVIHAIRQFLKGTDRLVPPGLARASTSTSRLGGLAQQCAPIRTPVITDPSLGLDPRIGEA